MNLWLCVTKDEYELPVAVASSPKELAAMLGLKEISIRNAVSYAMKNGADSRYVVVEVDDEDE